jgi:DinB family protein
MSLRYCAVIVSLVVSSGFAQPPVGRKAGLSTVLQLSYAGIKADLTAEAEKMPAEDYNFKPGSMPEVRTFGRLFTHVAAGQFGTCAAVKGVANPVAGKKSEEELTTKADITRFLAESFAFCDDAFASTTDQNALEFVRHGPNELTRASVLYGLLAHNAEMYGIGTVYLRLKGIVPPSTERQAKPRNEAR